jgi:hypothetical protein
LHPKEFLTAAREAGRDEMQIRVRDQEGYDHSYYFVSRIDIYLILTAYTNSYIRFLLLPPIMCTVRYLILVLELVYILTLLFSPRKFPKSVIAYQQTREGRTGGEVQMFIVLFSV